MLKKLYQKEGILTILNDKNKTNDDYRKGYYSSKGVIYPN